MFYHKKHKSSRPEMITDIMDITLSRLYRCCWQAEKKKTHSIDII